MSFYNLLKRFDNFDFDGYLGGVTDNDVINTLGKDKLNHYDLLNLLSDKAFGHLEEIAKKANRITTQYFGKTILLYAPIYISNYCQNLCLYCGFNRKNKIHRKRLTMDEIDKEAIELKSTGIEHVLLLTGEDHIRSGFQYIKDAIRILGGIKNII